jgi:hypothetical protein
MLMAMLLVAATTAQGASINVRTELPNWSYLNSLEQGRIETLFTQSVTVPYSQFEPEIAAVILAKVNQEGDKSGVVVCDDPCPDVTWSIESSSTFQFKNKNQPTLTVLGKPTDNRVRTDLTTEAEVLITAKLNASTWAGKVMEEVVAKVWIPVKIKATATITAWPIWNVEDVSVKLDLSGADVDLQINNGDIVKFAFLSGGTIGFTPGGALMGGPVGFSTLLAVLGATAGVDEATALLEKKVREMMQKVQDKANTQVKSKITKYIAPAVEAAQNLQQAMMGRTIPGAGKSLSELQRELGIDLLVRTDQTGKDIVTMVKLRFGGVGGPGSMSRITNAGLLSGRKSSTGSKPSGLHQGTIAGQIRFPKRQCDSKSKLNAGTGGNLITSTLKAANTDLKAGQSCLTLLSGGQLGSGRFSSQQFLGLSQPQWRSRAGKLRGLGTVREMNQWYECDFALDDIPSGFSSLQLSGSVQQRVMKDPMRVLLVGSTVYNAQLTKQAKLVIGGATGNCEDVSGGRVGSFTPPAKIQAPLRVQPDPVPLIKPSALGGQINVPKLSGKVLKSVPSKTSTEEKPRLRQMPGMVKAAIKVPLNQTIEVQQ